ncbi:hypothetical protein G5B30_16515 [Sphingobacterium sp. SGG-5]|uniref:hypothetical protein n=1 Tax=Sphingobacterium sp. SGG-5 TaxID=2710881 RepID=UPI0013EAF9D7|nr:hypothetical protein [Sphingobacterium sp. SGG-5]NGM63514.1 hypothetical protein [Sphingobacterium sp. SGG-5]
MKRLMPLFIIVFFLFSCSQSNESKAQKAVKKYLKENMNDPKSYEDVKWSSVDTVFAPYKGTEKSLVQLYKMDSLISELKKLSILMVTNYDKYKTYYKSTDSILNQHRKEYQLDSANYKEYIGYTITHIFRAKNGFGATVLNKNTFTLDKDLKEVISVEDKD